MVAVLKTTRDCLVNSRDVGQSFVLLILQTFVAVVLGSHALSFGYSLLFLLGRSYVFTGELEKASQFFTQAFAGIGTYDIWSH